MTAAAKPAGGNPGGKSSGSPAARSVARLAAVQALYQIDMTGIASDVSIKEFERHHLGSPGEGPEIDGAALAPADRLLFADVVGGVAARLTEIDGMIGKVLVEGWSVPRLESILRALLRAGAYELIARGDVPARVVVSEYVDIAHAFFTGKEAGLANGVLNQLARMLRPGEFSREFKDEPGASPAGS
jgi:N utilization substance protein B